MTPTEFGSVAGRRPTRRPLRAAAPLLRAALLVLLGLAGLAGLAVAQSDPWQGAELAFVGPDGRLHIGWRDGREPRPLSRLGERAQFPAWSPGGERIAAIVSGAAGRLVVYDADGSETELYGAGGLRGPIYHYWSPDGGTVAFLVNAPETGLELRLAAPVEVAAGGTSRVLAAGSPFYWQWAADAQRLLIHSGFSGEGARFGFTAASEDTLAANLSPPGFFQAPGIAPSGDWVAYSALAPGGERRLTLRSLTAPAAEAREVAHEGIAALAWSPTEDRLAFTAPPGPAPISAGPLQLLDAADGFLRTLSEDVVLAFFWSPDGARIAYITPLGDGPDPGRVATAPSAPVGAAQLLRVQRAQRLVQLKVVELASGQVATLTTFAPTALWLGQYLPFFDQYALSHRIWSQDGRALVLPMRDELGVSRVTVVALDGTLTPLAIGDMPFWRWR